MEVTPGCYATRDTGPAEVFHCVDGMAYGRECSGDEWFPYSWHADTGECDPGEISGCDLLTRTGDLPLTAERAVEMLEALKGKVVLGEWEHSEKFGHFSRVSENTQNAVVIDRGGKGWVAISGLLPSKFVKQQFATIQEAKSAVDAELAKLPNVLFVKGE